jgi:hypothetical protein
MFDMVDALSFADLPDNVIGFAPHTLPCLAKAIAHGGPVKIVAMGSSSTAGRADVVPYPYWLEMYLRAQYYKDEYPDRRIDVLNRGMGGQEAKEELLRFEIDIFAHKPAMVIWQVGTNAVFHNDKYKVDDIAHDIKTGLQRLRDKLPEADVMLIDPQYVTAMLFDDKADLAARMVELILKEAGLRNVGVFHRWALMRHWHVHNSISFERMLDPTDDAQLHQSDASTQRLARGLCDTIVKAVAAVPTT